MIVVFFINDFKFEFIRVKVVFVVLVIVLGVIVVIFGVVVEEYKKVYKLLVCL